MKEEDIRPQDLFNRYLELARLDVERILADRSGFVDVPCPACGADQPRNGLTKLGFTYVVCGECASLYASPRPSQSQLDAYYRDAEAVRFWSTHFYRQTLDARRKKIFRPRALLVKRLAKLLQLEHASFVDVGAGYGVFLEEVNRLRLFDEVVGVEPNAELASVCRERGFRVIEMTAEGIAERAMSASFASSFEVLEHVYEPLGFLEGIRRLLAPGGALLLTTLTVSGFDIQLLWEHSKSVYPPLHLNLMSVEGMERLFERAGYEIHEASTPGQLDVDIVANMVAEDPSIELPRFVDYLLRMRGAEARRDLQRFLQKHRLSSHIRVVARVPVASK